jgi:Flp pilus assembly protein TadG
MRFLMSSRRSRCQQGASAVEFVIIATVLAMVLFGIVEFSLILYDKAMITNASREGARAGIVFKADPVSGDYLPTSEDEIGSIVDNYLQNRLITFSESPPDVATAVDYQDLDSSGDITSGDYRIVTVSYTYQYLLLPNFVAALTGGMSLAATTRMRME